MMKPIPGEGRRGRRPPPGRGGRRSARRAPARRRSEVRGVLPLVPLVDDVPPLTADPGPSFAAPDNGRRRGEAPSQLRRGPRADSATSGPLTGSEGPTSACPRPADRAGRSRTPTAHRGRRSHARPTTSLPSSSTYSTCASEFRGFPSPADDGARGGRCRSCDLPDDGGPRDRLDQVARFRMTTGIWRDVFVS